MIDAPIDAEVYNADWPKRTPDKIADLTAVAKHGDPSRPGYALLHPGGARATIGERSLSKLIDALLDGGFTVDSFNGKGETSGYVVAIPSFKSSFRNVSASSDRTETKRWLVDYIKRVRAAAQSNPRVKLGGWYDKEHGELTLDHVELFPNNRRGVRRAMKEGRLRDEQAIFHLDTMTEIPLGGTGGRQPN